MECPACQQSCPASSRYCPQCGSRLPPPTHPAVQDASLGRSAPGERRQLTILFCDLVDATGLSERLAPGELRRLLARYQSVCAAVVERFDGHVAESQGDQMLAYFSYPRAHEDDAERAVRAGLDLVAEVQRIDSGSGPGAELCARVGIHTGRVVVGELGERQDVALGHALNLGARLHRVARPGAVVVSGKTLRLVPGLFVTEALGGLRLKGIEEPVAAHRVLRATGIRSRLDAVPSALLTELTGREPDLASLMDYWKAARAGEGRVVLLSGEAGVGKSRLLRAIRERLATEPHTWLELRASPQLSNSAFQPVIEFFRRRLGIAPSGAAEAQLHAIEQGADLAGLPRAEAVPVLARLLGVPSGSGQARELPETSRTETLDVLTRWLVALAGAQPTLWIFEDLHWSDPSTLALLDSVVDRVRGLPTLVLCSFRPPFARTWTTRPEVAQHVVQPLAGSVARDMVSRIPGAHRLSPVSVEGIVERTDGVPLFIEELTRSVIEAGHDEAHAIPASLEDSLMARLDRLGPGKEIAQLGALIGREFSREEIAAVSGADSAALQKSLDGLVGAQLLFDTGGAETGYAFKHALIQDAAEQSLLRERRRSWQARIVGVFEERFPERVEAEPERMARHCEAGDLPERAIAYYERAARLAMERSAPAEAVHYLESAAALVEQLPPGPSRAERELAVQVALGAACVSSLGWGSEEAERAYNRARQLCDEIGDRPETFPVVRGLVTFYTSRADLDTARELAQRLLRLGEESPDTSHRLLAHHQAGIVHCFGGDQDAALDHFRVADACYDPEAHRGLASLYQADPGVLVRSWRAWPLWLSGDADEALRSCRSALGLARADDHPFSINQALASVALVHLWRGERGAAVECAEESIRIAARRGFAALEAGSTVTRALARLHSGASTATIEGALQDFQRAAAWLGSLGSNGSIRPLVLGMVGEALLDIGRIAEARAAVDAGLAFSSRTSAAFFDAGLHRMRAALLLAEGAVGPARDALRTARDIARRQGARTLELRALSDLCACAGSPEREAEVRRDLARCLESFPAESELPDLVRARSLVRSPGPGRSRAPRPVSGGHAAR